MLTIRNTVFETNSSSMHAIVFSRDGIYVKDQDIEIDFNLYLADRRLIYRDSINDRATLVNAFFTIKFNNFYGGTKGTFTDPLDFTKEEIDFKNLLYARFMEWITKFWKNNLMGTSKVKFLNSEQPKIKKGYASKFDVDLGCYGWESVINELNLEPCLDDLNTYLLTGDKNESRIFRNEDDYSFMIPYRALDFIFGKHSAIIQGSDEMKYSDIKKQDKYVQKLVNKSKGHASVLWPLGG